MAVPRGRSLNLVDGMILIAMTAIGMSPIPRTGGNSWLSLTWLGRDPSRGWFQYVTLYGDAARVFLPVLIGWTIAVLAIRLRRPRPTGRRLARQPGMIACLAATVMLVLIVPPILFGDDSRFSPHATRLKCLIFGSCGYVPPAIIGAWVSLLPGRRWRPEPGPIDRLGIAIGWIWISIGADILARTYQ